MAPQKIIIDTDPGVDDILALLLALSASKEELEVLLISLTFGNINVENCLRNAVSLFHILELERQWRVQNGRRPGFEALAAHKPIVAVGADGPLEEDEKVIAAYFHGKDGLGGIHTKAPHFTPAETWSHLFNPTASTPSPPASLPPNFTPSALLAHEEILRLLRENDPDTITIVALGPLTNLALAASADTETFLRAKEVVVMGGAIEAEGNVTPVAEFNTHACAFSAAYIFSLTSPNPSSTMPPSKSLTRPGKLSRRLNLTLVPLDATTQHLLSETAVVDAIRPLDVQESPLAQWSGIFLDSTFRKMETLYAPVAGVKRQQDVDVSLHDPLCIWYVLTKHLGIWKTVEGRDIRVEAVGQWTRGMCVVERRTRVVEEGVREAVGDSGGWLHRELGNRVRQLISGECEESFAADLLDRVYGC
ncbi:hypothetical protein RUND412_001853 [Rhizina undulata]